METEIKLEGKVTYISPDIKIVDVEIEQNILAGVSVPEMGGEDW